MNRTKVTVSVEGPFGRFCAGINVPDYLEEQFRPADLCDDPLIASLAGGVCEVEYRKLVALRKDAAQDLAADLTRVLIDAMSEHDTENGYRKERSKL